MADETKRKTAKTRKTTKRTKKTATTVRKRAVTKRAKTKPAPGGTLRVRQVRSGIGHAYPYRRTLRALGLKHHQDEIVVVDNPSIRGMLFKVRHLVRVTEEK